MVRKNKDGKLTSEEKKIVKALLKRKCRNQDIQYLINIGRSVTINSARITEVRKNNSQKLASDDEVETYIAEKRDFNFKTELSPHKNPHLVSGREAMVAAVQAFNNPASHFRARTFAVLANIAWTNILHEYYVQKKISIWKGQRTLLLSQMIKRDDVPLENAEKENLNALKDIRDAIEHNYWLEAESEFTPIFLACCLNFNEFLIKNFGKKTALSNELGLALQFAKMDFMQLTTLNKSSLPAAIKSLSDDLFGKKPIAIKDNTKYAFQVAYTLTSASKGQANFQFFKPESETGQQIHNVLKQKVPSDELYPYKPSDVCKKVEKKLGKSFNMHQHTLAWKKHKVRPEHRAKHPEKTKSQFCHYDTAHRDYMYTDAWVDKLVSENKT